MGEMTVGEFVRRRRIARGMTEDTVERAAALAGRTGGLNAGLSVWLTQIEDDATELSLRDACLLAHAIDFDLHALAGLAAGAPPPICRVCACSDQDPCHAPDDDFETCDWAEDGLCSACVDKEGPLHV